MTIRYSNELINKAEAEGFTFNVRFLPEGKYFATTSDVIIVTVNGEDVRMQNTAYACTPRVDSDLDFIIEDIKLDGSNVKEVRVTIKEAKPYSYRDEQHPVYKVA